MGVPLRRLLRNERSATTAISTDSDKIRPYDQLGRGNDFETRVEVDNEDNWVSQPEPTKQGIMVTQSFTTQ
jgi:hypothetical protein